MPLFRRQAIPQPRQRVALVLLAATLLPASLLAAQGSRLVQRLAAGVPQSVVVYGTSLTTNGPWVGQMRDWMTNNYAGSLTVANSGLSGKNSKDGLLNLDASVLAHRPDTVLIEFGMNDAFTNYADTTFNLSVAQARSNLETIIHRILTNRSDTEIILQTMNTVWDSTNVTNSVSATMRPNLAAYYQMYRDVAADKGLLLVDHEPNWRSLQTSNPTVFGSYVNDGTHPTSNGTAAITMPELKRRLIGDVNWLSVTSGPVLVTADVCVYGDTAAAVAAAVQVARQGRTCVLVAPQSRLGGMTSGGLGQTDVGSSGTTYIGGLAREFYRRIYWTYRDNVSWTVETRAAYVARSGTDPDEVNHLQVTFEPKIALRTMNEMLAESGATAIHARLLRSGGGVKKSGQRITEIATDDGTYFIRANAFIDASYEGDLMAEAGVPYVVGREANTNYGETINGIETSRAAAHQLPNGVDPYVEAGNPASGLLPGIEPAIGGADGTADTRLQAYNYRMCLTDIASNRTPIPQPVGYNEDDYQLLFRALAAGMGTNFYNKGAMPNRKTDSNNNGGFSTDFIGGNYSITGGWNYAEASYAKRDEIIAAHRRYQIGFMWALQNSTNISAAIRSNANWSVTWGLPLDEFGESENWPSQLYIREARRMLGEFVMTQHQVNQTPGYVVTDPVAMGAYTMDSHHVQRYVTTNGFVKNEGDVQVAVSRGPYGISYRSLVPPSNSVQNLLVPVGLAASHVALGSIRMEPVYMELGHAAGSAAVQALNDNVAVQSNDYAKLRSQLIADEQILPGSASTNAASVIVDNTDATGVLMTGTWIASTATAGFYGTNYLHDNNTNKGASSVRFTPTLPADGLYTVQLRWTINANRATNVPVDVIHPNGSNTYFVNMQASNGVWVTLLATNFLAGTNASVVVRNDNTRISSTVGFVIADAVQFVAGSNTTETVRALAADAHADESADTTAHFTVMRDTAGASPLTVFYAASGTATPTNDYTALAGSVTIPAGARTAPVVVQAVTDDVIEGDETVVVTLASNAAYLVDAPASATVTVHDRPSHAWKFAHFSAAQRTNDVVSGDFADPDGDGRVNLAEYALGGDPLAADSNIDPTARLLNVSGLRLRMEYNKAVSSLSYATEQSGGPLPGGWSTAGVSDEVYLPTTGRFAREIVVAPTDTIRFLRLRISE